MTLTLVTVGAASALLGSGYLFGARRGRTARAALAAHAESREVALREAESRLSLERRTAESDAARRRELESILVPLTRQTQTSNEELEKVEELKREVRAIARSLAERDSHQDELRREVRGALASFAKQPGDEAKLEGHVRRLVAPLLQREEQSEKLRDALQEVLRPMIERERMGRDLARLPPSTSGLGGLPKLLDAIAERGGFTAVVLSDDVGLPLAASAGALDVETLAGSSSLLLTLADRAARDGAPPPQAVVVRDASNQTLLHRIFRVGDERFMLTAVARGVEIATGALDPALGTLERALARNNIAA
ncbi:MAG: hypothetical protein U0414_27470 [Polyangiaceae bacterium]